MINELNVHIFDYIFSINEDIKEDIKEDENQYRNELNNKIHEISDIVDFWQEYECYFNDRCVLFAKTLGGTSIVYNNFPRFKIDTRKCYLEYKLNEIKISIDNNGDFIASEVEKKLVGIENCARKAILDYCEKKGVIEYKGKVFISADNHPAYAIIYQNIKAIIHEKNDYLFNQSIVQNIFNGNNYGTVNQTNNIENVDEKIYDVILEKLDALKLESNLDDNKVQEIQECCHKKDKNKLVQFLKEIAMGTGTNLIATGILAMFGLM
ncbi:MAG: hypothetical protein IKL55_02045 [Clostridia bacterium]|nr:hypothetical protein [Clostridia bacterium]